MSRKFTGPINKIDDYRWEIPADYQEGMRVPGVIYANKHSIDAIRDDATPIQVANVACLPGIIKASLAMPDIHWGYGFPIGGVAAVSIDEGVISPGGVGYDINCGVRAMRTNLEHDEIKTHLKTLIDALFNNIPCGLGKGGRIKLGTGELKNLLKKGSSWALEQGMGQEGDVEHTEAKGELPDADPNLLSSRALDRGKPQVGTLGSGNHFLEIQVVDEIYDERIANVLGLFPNQIIVMIHTGSRGLGYQVCDDFLKIIGKAQSKYNISLPDRQLASVPVKSEEGQNYLSAMACAANYAWCNRQVITHWTREVFYKVLEISPRDFGGQLIYDIAHNIAKFEEHTVEGEKKKVLVHRKGATRSFGPGSADIPDVYLDVGQPVIVPGSMGTASYILVGTETAMEETFGSTCHGAGRTMSRTGAKKAAKGRSIFKEMESKGILVRAFGKGTVAEEMPEAYKDVDDVINVVDGSGISKKVARMKPLAVMKG
jgi:tRNA-splicing ligase RtcB